MGTRNIKTLLLDQTVVAGLGNWVCDDVLYNARIDPRTRGCDLTTLQLKNLYESTEYIINTACDVDADSSRFPPWWLFHKRWKVNQKNKDTFGAKIQYIKCGGRTTLYVQRFQHKANVEVPLFKQLPKFEQEEEEEEEENKNVDLVKKSSFFEDSKPSVAGEDTGAAAGTLSKKRKSKQSNKSQELTNGSKTKVRRRDDFLKALGS